MVRVNIINPANLADQHLLAEYHEILMLAAYLKKHPSLDDVPKCYCLGKGHMKFFKDKIKYLSERHRQIRVEMIRRGFRPKIVFRIKGFRKSQVNGWKPSAKDKEIIKKRLIEKFNKKPGFYRYYGKKAGIRKIISLASRD